MNLNKTELIEAYLQGKLSGAEKAAFETQLEQDPLFRSEIELQSDIISSIKTYRKNQLKERLNNIEVPSGSFITSSAAKVAGSIIVAAFLGLFSYNYFNSEESVILQDSSQITETFVSKQAIDDLPLASEQKSGSSFNEIQQTDDKVVEPTSTTAVEETKTLRKPLAARKESTEQVITPNVIDSFAETSSIIKDNKVEYTEENHTLTSNKITEIEISNEDVKNKNLKYKYLNKKLYLYGDFSSSPYELMELNSYNGKKLFLFHNNAYFQLNEDQKNTAPLVPIEDSLLIQELDTLRHEKTN